MNDLLEGRWALVTGASRGIGKAIAEALAGEKVHLALHYFSSEDSIREVAETCRDQGVEVEIFQADLSEPEGAEKLADAVRAKKHPIEILVNNAGIVHVSPFWGIGSGEWNRVQQVNLETPRILMTRFLPWMIRGRWGRIVNIGSILAEWGGKGNSAYAVSKSGLNALTRAVALETARKGVTANVIAPGLVRTDMTEAMGEDSLERLVGHIPLKRPAAPAEVAQAVVFLCRCGYVTAEIIHIDGGLRYAY